MVKITIIAEELGIDSKLNIIKEKGMDLKVISSIPFVLFSKILFKQLNKKLA